MTDEGADGVRPDVGPNVKRAPLPDWWWRQSLRSRRIIAVAVLVALVLIAGAAIRALRSGDDRYAAAYAFVESLPPETVAEWDDLAQCESNGDWSADTGNGFFGGLQFEMSSWIEVGGEGQPNETPRDEQIYRADKLRQLQGYEAWPVCAPQLGLE